MTSALSRRAALVAAASLALAAPFAHAQQNYPNKPIRMLVGYSAGGGVDALARMLAQRLSTALGQQVVVENRAGASGNIGMDAAAKSPPDGYTIVMGQTSNLAVNPTLYSIATLTGHAARAVGPYSALVENGAARRKGLSADLAMIGDLWADPSEISRSRREDFSFGAGPHSTPLIVGDRLFTVGTNQQLFAFDKRSGKIVNLSSISSRGNTSLVSGAYAAAKCGVDALTRKLAVEGGGVILEKPGEIRLHPSLLASLRTRG